MKLKLIIILMTLTSSIFGQIIVTKIDSNKLSKEIKKLFEVINIFDYYEHHS